jgi:hypothetical protein
MGMALSTIARKMAEEERQGDKVKMAFFSAGAFGPSVFSRHHVTLSS